MRESAVVIAVPEAAPAVDEWRRQHTYDAPLGVPAHVTLLYPFVPPERLGEDAETRLGAIVGEAEPFEFVLARAARFPSLLYLAPEPAEPFLRLTEAIAAAWPQHPPYEGAHDVVIPHLTVAEADGAVLDEIAQSVKPRLPIKARATEALLLEEGEDGFWRKRRRFLLGALLVLAIAFAGCGKGGGTAVAHVGPQAITKQQLDAVVEHFREEAKREGRQFPDEGTQSFRQLRNRLLGLLVYRTELRQAAKRLGITVTDKEVSKWLGAGAGETEGKGEGDSFARDSVATQLAYERIYRKLTRGVRGKTREELSARRNQIMAVFVAKLQRETRVRYEPGYSPSP